MKQETSSGPAGLRRDRARDIATLARGLGLLLRVHADAFRLDPLGYLQAVGWRARGLKVRSRNRIATLAGRSTFAYPFWMAWREPVLHSGLSLAAPALPVVAVIDCRQGQAGLLETVQGLGGGARIFLLGDASAPGATSAATMDDLAQKTGAEETWLCALRPGDRLAADALNAYATAVAASPNARIAYADDDLIDPAGVRHSPHFKPDWNPELFEHHDFITGSSIVKVTDEDISAVPDFGWAEALVARALEHGQAPLHIPLVLHHRRTRPQPVLPAKSKAIEATGLPPVTVIIPTRNRADLLRKCIEGLDRTDYPKLDVLVVDNESDEPESIRYLAELRSRGLEILPVAGPFNYSRLNNRAVEHARGNVLCFLNNDIEMLQEDWLALLVRKASAPDIGAVGARLLYPDGSIQHAGVYTGIGGGAGHAHRYENESSTGYFQRARLPQRVSAVTGACLVVERDKFLAVGGFDEEDFPVAFNDVDLCLKLNERGWQSFYEPRATLTHHESKSRGSDRSKINRARFAEELATLKRKWRTDERRDPFHHPQLSPHCEHFLISV